MKFIIQHLLLLLVLILPCLPLEALDNNNNKKRNNNLRRTKTDDSAATLLKLHNHHQPRNLVEGNNIECTPPTFHNCFNDQVVPEKYYIDPINGNDDNNNGMDPSSAFQSLKKAMLIATTSTSSSPDQSYIFYLLKGNHGPLDLSLYSDSLVRPVPSRTTSGSWIQFVGLSEGENNDVELDYINLLRIDNVKIAIRDVVIKSTTKDSSGGRPAINLQEVNQFRLHNVTIDPSLLNDEGVWDDFHSQPQGIRMREVTNVIISSTTIVGGRYGMVIGPMSSQIKVDSCNIGYQFGDAIRVTSSDDIHINNNHIHNVQDYQNTGEHIDGIQFFASGPAGSYPQPSNIVITNNTITDMPGQMIFVQSNYIDEIGYIENVTIKHNLLGPKTIDDDAIPIQLQGVQNYVMEYNTIYDQVLIRDDSTGLIKNNLIINGSLGVQTGGNIVSQYNVIVGGDLNVRDDAGIVDIDSNTVIMNNDVGDSGGIVEFIGSDFTPMFLEACIGSSEGLAVGYKPICDNVCEWASSSSSLSSPATLFAIQPARIYVNEEATFIPKASQGCSSSSSTTNTNTTDGLLLSWIVSDGRQIVTSTIDDSGVPESISMSFPTAGTHQVTLTIQDSSSTGGIGSLSRYITVSPNDPSLLVWYELKMESLLIDSSAYANDDAIFQTLSTGLIGHIPHHMIDSSTNCGSSIDLDGDSGLKLPSKARNSINDLSSVTAGIWAKFDDAATTTTSGGRRAQLFYKHVTIGIRVEDGNVLCAAGTASTFKETSSAAVGGYQDNEWHHFVVAFDGFDVKCYMDGQFLSSKAVSTTTTTTNPENLRSSNYDLTLGYNMFKPDRHMEGNLKDFRMYDKVMSLEEVQAWYDDEHGRVTSTPTALVTVDPSLEIFVGQDATIYPDASYSCGTADIVQATLHISDGRSFDALIENGVLRPQTVLFTTAGTYQITLSLQDSNGATDTSSPTILTVKNGNPNLLASYELSSDPLSDSSSSNFGDAIFKTLSTGTVGPASMDLSWSCGSSVSFDGDSGLVLPSETRNSINDLPSVTAGIWAKIDKTGRAQLFYKHVTIGIRVDYGKVLCAGGTATTKKFYETPGVAVDYQDDAWHHFVVTFDGLDVKCYMDGQHLATKSSPTLDTVRIGNWDLTLGYHVFKADRKLEGNLKDFRMYSTALSLEEIQSWYEDANGCN